MQVLKLFYRLMLSRKYTILAFVVIFFAVVLSSNWANEKLYQTSFDPKHETLGIGLVNEDEGSIITDSLIEYLKKEGRLVEIEENDEEVIDKLFNLQIDDAIIIPEGYGENLLEAALDADKDFPKLERVQGPYEDTSAYVDQIIGHYISNFQMNALIIEDVEDEGQVKEMLEYQAASLENNIEIVESEKEGNLDLILYGLAFALMAAYIYFVIFISSFGTPALAMREETVATRERMTSLTNRSRNIQFFVGCTSFFIIVWLLSTIVAVAMYGSDIIMTETGRLLVLSSFLSTFGISAIGFFVATIAPNRYFLTFCEVALGLIVAFGSGIFVPISTIGKTLQNIVSFAPAIWQVRANNILLSSTSLTDQQIQEIARYFMIMLLLGLAYYAVSFVIMRYRSRASR